MKTQSRNRLYPLFAIALTSVALLFAFAPATPAHAAEPDAPTAAPGGKVVVSTQEQKPAQQAAPISIEGKDFKVSLTPGSEGLGPIVPIINGKALPDVKVTSKKYGTLKEGRDYTVSFSKNTIKYFTKDTGEAKIEGIGKYSGTRTEGFLLTTFVDLDRGDAKVAKVADQMYNGKAKKPKPKVTAGRSVLKEGVHYTLSYKNNVNPGIATIVIKGTEKTDNVLGTTTVKFRIKDKGKAVYWLVDKKTGESLYTTDANEVRVLSQVQKTWRNMGAMWTAPSVGAPVYRLCEKATGNHLYTADRNEINVLTKQRKTWTMDNRGKAMWYSKGTKRVYRLFSPARANGKQPGTHCFVTNKNQVNFLKQRGWKLDDMKMYGMKVSTSIEKQIVLEGLKGWWRSVAKTPKGTYTSYYYINGSTFTTYCEAGKNTYKRNKSGKVAGFSHQKVGGKDVYTIKLAGNAYVARTANKLVLSGSYSSETLTRASKPRIK